MGARSFRLHLGQVLAGLFDDHVGQQHAVSKPASLAAAQKLLMPIRTTGFR